MKRFAEVVAWENYHALVPAHVDCATAVMLKILDGKCKMKTEEKQVMRHLYHAVKNKPGQLLKDDMHSMIARAEASIDDAIREEIYEKRVLAETMISRPVMKQFKALIRQQGLFAESADAVHQVELNTAMAGAQFQG